MAINYELIEKGNGLRLTFLARDDERLSAKTKAVLAQLGHCGTCGAPLAESTLRCTAVAESGSGHFGIWLSPDDWEKVESLLDIERGRARDRRRAESRADRMEFVSGFHTKTDIETIRMAQGGECYYCGKELTPAITKRDHMTAVANGGSEWPSNMALACVDCNHTKSNRGAVAFWNYLRKTRGAAWVTKRRNACRDVDKVKRELTVQRRAALTGCCKELERKLNAGLANLRETGVLSDADYAGIDVRHTEGGIQIQVGCVAIDFPPSAHRRVQRWESIGWNQLLDAIVKLTVQAGALRVKRSSGPATAPEKA